MSYELLLRPGRINTMPMRNRFITGPMERSMANRDGSLNQTYIDYLAARARGGASLIVIESTYVDTRGMGDPFQVGCHADHVIPGLRRAAEAVHVHGCKLALELNFGGRVTPSRSSQRQPIGPSVVPCDLLDPVPIPREMTAEDIEDVTSRFVAAAERVHEAGLDMIHLHGAHGYLLGAFLSPRTNRRTDEYGGSLAGRARFALDILAAVRAVVGPDFPIGYRLSADEYVEGGLRVDEAARFATMLAGAGIDLIDVAGGSYESVTMITQGAGAPRGGFVENAQIIKDAVGTQVPVSVAQRLNDPDFANEVLFGGIDFITLSRAFHADPDYVQKLIDGRAAEIVPCIACQSCSELLAVSRPARCTANPSTGLERRRRLPQPKHRRKVMIVGGGPAGMQAARLLGAQSHSVVLYEKSAALGGQVRYSSRLAPDYADLVTFLSGQMAKLGVDVRLGVAAGTEAIDDEHPDAVVVATGATGGLWFCPVQGAPRTFDLFGALDRAEADWEEQAVVIGGDFESLALSLHIARCGGSVHVVEPRRDWAYNRGGPARLALLEALGEQPRVRLHAESTVEEVGEGYVMIQNGGRLVGSTGSTPS